MEQPMNALVFLLLQAAPFRAEFRVEEGADGGDSTTASRAVTIVKPGEAMALQLDGARRRVIRPPLSDAARFHPLELVGVDRAAWPSAFEVSRIELAGERPLPESVEGGRVLRASVAGKSLAVAGRDGPEVEGFRLVPKSEAVRSRFEALAVWVEKDSARPVRVEAEGKGWRWVATRESLKELESVEERWFR